MGRGQRHSKNAGIMGSEALTYHERKALGFGTVKERVGKDSQANYYDCRLTLTPAVDPMVTPDGYLYSREALLENLLQQKKAIKKRQAAYEAQQQDEAQKAAEQTAVQAEAALIAFDRQNHMGISSSTARKITDAISAEAATMHEAKGTKAVVSIKENEEKMKQLKAFWVPSQAPTSKDLLAKPDTTTFCPASGKKLRLKDCVAVRFTRAPEGEAQAGASSSGQAGSSSSGLYMDPVTMDTFTNASKLVVIAPTGDVVTEATYNTCIKPDGEFKGKRVGPKDIIRLQGGGTGFAAHDGDKAQVHKHFALGPGSGRADLRGQHQGPRSHFGLVFNN